MSASTIISSRDVAAQVVPAFEMAWRATIALIETSASGIEVG